MRFSLSLIVLFLALNSQSATYHVDYSAGSDSANGTSTATPWKRCPGDTNATGTALNATLSAGDVVKFRGGISYTGTIDLNWSGATNSPITYDGNHAGDWGTGRAVIEKDYESYTTGGGGADRKGMLFRGVAAKSFLTFKGFELRNVGGYPDDDSILLTNCSTNPITVVPDGYAFLFYDITAGRNMNLRFENLYFNRIGQWRNTQPFSGTESVSGGGIFIRNAKSMVVTNCEFTKMKVAIELSTVDVGGFHSTEDVEIVNVNIHNSINWGVDIRCNAPYVGITNVTVHNSRIWDIFEFQSGNWQGCGDPPHTDGIFLATGGNTNSYWSGVKIYNNDFYCVDRGSSVSGTACIFLSQGPSVDIYNNVFWAWPDYITIAIDHDNYSVQPQTVRVMNNTFFGQNRSLNSQSSSIGSVTSDMRQVYLFNNLFQLTNGISSGGTSVDSETALDFRGLNYNLYYDPDWNVVDKKLLKFGTDYYNLANLRAVKGWESNGIYSTPFMVNANGSPYGSSNVLLQAVSPAIGTGTNLNAYFTTDKAGNVRGSTWDIGAYEWEPVGTWRSPPPPYGVQIYGGTSIQGSIRIIHQ